MPTTPITLSAGPAPIDAAVARLAERTVLPSPLRTAEWEAAPLQVRHNGFFSAGVEWGEFLSHGQTKLLDALAMRKEQVANGQAYVDRSSFIGDMRKMVLSAGMQSPGDRPDDLRNIASRARLGLIYDMQTRQAYNFARWQNDSDPLILNAFPAQELVRLSARRAPRNWQDRWIAARGTLISGRMIALKTDPIWTDISRFGVPWPPFDFGSGMGVRDISRREAESLGLIAPGDRIQPEQVRRFEESLQAPVSDIRPDILKTLLSLFGRNLAVENGLLKWIVHV
jgi:hypothetical protein